MIFHILTAVLILLKVFGIIAISWWLVLAPSLAVIAISALFVLIAIIAMVKLTK